MDIENIKPSETYEGLKKQFFALKVILQSNQAEVEYYRKRIKEFKVDRIIELEAELESQKEMNSILTKELSMVENSNITVTTCSCLPFQWCSKCYSEKNNFILKNESKIESR